MKRKSLKRGGNAATANANTPASVATAADAVKASQAGIRPAKAPRPSAAPQKPRKTKGRGIRKPTPPADTVTISRKLAECFAKDALNSMDSITIGFSYDTAGYLKCLADNAGVENEGCAIKHANIYRTLMLALGKGGDLPEPRAYVKQVKAKAVRITVYFPGSKSEELDACTQRSHLGKREFVKIAVRKYMREVKTAGGLTWSIASRKDGGA